MRVAVDLILSIGMLSTIPLMLMDLANRLIPYPIRRPADLARLAC